MQTMIRTKSPGNVDGFISACRAFDELRDEYASQVTKIREAEKFETATQGELARVERRMAGGDQTLDLREAQALAKRGKKIADEERQKLEDLPKQIEMLSDRIAGSAANMIPVLESEIEERGEQRETLLNTLLMARLKEREKMNSNGERPAAELALENLDDEVADREAALEIAKGLIKDRAGAKAKKLAAPQIETAIRDVEKSLNAYEAASAKLSDICDPLETDHAIKIPGGIPRVQGMRKLRAELSLVKNFFTRKEA